MGKHSLPLGFRFHPTDVELLKYYLKRKLLGKKFSFEAIADVDIYKYAPWDLPDLSCLKSGDLKWFFFCPIGKKYARGGRLNRATVHGYWKSTGKDKAVKYNEEVVGMIRTLVFHRGKSPCGDRTDWVMHEYRLEEKELTDRGVVQDSYVLCVVFQKDGMGPKNGAQYGAPFKEEEWSDNEDSNLVETGFLSCVSKLSSGGASSSYVTQSLCAEPYVDSSGRHTPVPQMTINSTVSILSDIDSNAQSLVVNTDTNGATTFIDALDHPIVVPAVMKVPQIELDSSALPLMVTTDTNGASTCVDAPSHPLVVNDPNVVPAAMEAPQLAQVQESSDNILSMLDFFTEEDIIDSGLMTGNSNPSNLESPQFSSDDDIPAMLAFFVEDHVNTLF